MERFAALLDTRSIQRYIFAGNKLKTNIGASYLVEKVYAKELFKVLNDEPFKFNIDVNAWWDKETIEMENNDDLQCEIAYIGGGNALVLFKEDIAKEVVATLTKRLLCIAPGLKTGAALGEVILKEGEKAYKDSVDKLYRILKVNQNNIVPQVSVPYTGLTVECEISGQAANVLVEEQGNQYNKYISAETMAKLEAADTANKEIQGKFKTIKNLTGFKFTDEIEKLGQKEKDEYISIVHIDGNNMGAKFQYCNTLLERKELSKEVSAASLEAFKDLLEKVVIKEYQYYIDKEILDDVVTKAKILPIRPIILGGDDITFVCAGKLGIIYAKRFIEFLQEHTLKVNGVSVPFSACAGVALLPTKYPFFRGYQLAEELCDVAKSKSRAEETELKKKIDAKQDGIKITTSWLEYTILHGEQEPTLSQIREQEYTGDQGNLHFGPYKIGPIDNPYSIEILLNGALEFGLGNQETALNVRDEESKWASNKIKGLRDVIRKGPNEIEFFMKQLQRQQKKLPAVAKTMDSYREKLWNIRDGEMVTPYLDMIEVMEYMYNYQEAQRWSSK